MNFKQFISESKSVVARNNALKKQQELIDDGKKKIEVLKLPGGVYALTYESKMRRRKHYFCTPDGRIEYLDIDPKQVTIGDNAYYYADKVLKGPFPEGEKEIAKGQHHAFLYAKNILKGRFPAGEKVFAEHLACSYAIEILDGPFPEGEKDIATDDRDSYYYALRALKGPFPAGEAVIAKDLFYAFCYAKNVLRGPFPAGEAIIATHAESSYHYARDIIKDRFPAGEKVIMESRYKDKYEEFLASLDKKNSKT